MPSFTQPGTVRSYQREGNTLLLDCDGPVVAITPLTDRIIRVRLAPEGAFEPRRSWAVARSDEEFPGAGVEISTTEQTLVLETSTLSLRIDLPSSKLTFFDARQQPFCADEIGLQWQSDGAGARQVACSKRIEAGEHFYGFGERTGKLDKLGQRLVNWTTDQYQYGPCTDPLYIAIPTFLALRPGLAYGVFFNNTWHSRFDMGAQQPGVWRMEADGGDLDYYLVYGPTPEEVVAGFGQILGTTPLPPRWSLGYHQSRWSYKTEADVRQVAAEFRRRGIPCDTIHLDIDHMDGYRNFTWNGANFPDPRTLIADLQRDGFRVVTIADAGVKVDPDYPLYADGMERNMFLRRSDGEVFQGFVWPDDSVFADFMRPDVRAWWGEHQHDFVQQGISGIWNDMNEPTVFAIPFSQGGGDPGTIDLDIAQGPACDRATHAEVHNLYGSAMAQTSYEGLKHSRGERPFVLTRAAYAGIQRWSACWMGDNASRWEHLEMAMPQLMNMGLSGVPLVGTDIGGFYGNASGELFARWMQLGLLMPFSRGHSAADTERHEPWVFGPEIEEICTSYLRLRYRLLPYLYSLCWESSRSGAPLLRPLLYHFPDDSATYQLHDQLMLGPSLLAAPIYQPGREHRHVYLPAGDWFDWWTGEQITGPTHLLAQAPLERMPLYVRAGAIIASGPELSYTDEKALDPLTLDLYPGDGAFSLYEDDGFSFDYQQGQLCLTDYRLRKTGERLSFEIGARAGSYTPPRRQLVVRLHGASRRTAADYPGAQYDAERGVLTLLLDDDGQSRQLDFVLDEAAELGDMRGR
ncbi:MAG TPA: glycoside hydrolase family 31 protein [Herpetosiphonaceae bacterium]